jgi:uncharacterized membrane protein
VGEATTAAPGTPRARVQLLCQAFLATLRDPEFWAEADKSQLDIEPISGEEVERTVSRLFELSPAVATRLKEVLAPN